jgi:hypothetical protein
MEMMGRDCDFAGAEDLFLELESQVAGLRQALAELTTEVAA